jgi:nicotinate-nucleotide adenylyltransferase
LELVEVERGGVSYTTDTLAVLHQREPGVSWILVLGGDQLPGFEQWRSFDRVMDLASAAFSPRPGHDLQVPDGLASRLRRSWSGGPGEILLLPSTGLDLASSRLRQDLQGTGTAEGIPLEVLAAIQAENLYR